MIAWGSGISSLHLPPEFFAITNAQDAVAGDNYVLVLKTDGTVSGYGPGEPASVPVGLNHVISIAGGSKHAIALKSDGHVVAWGNNSSHQCNVPPDLSDVKMIAAGGTGNVALRADGTVHPWGGFLLAGLNVPSNVTNVRAVGTDGNWLFALTQDGQLLYWGAYDVKANPIYGNKYFTRNISKIISKGNGLYQHMLGIDSDGIPFATNLSPIKNLSQKLKNVVDLASQIALQADGTVKTWKYNSSVFLPSSPPPANPPTGLHGVSFIATGKTGGSQFENCYFAFGQTDFYFYDDFSRDSDDLVLGENWHDDGHWVVEPRNKSLSSSEFSVAILRSSETSPIQDVKTALLGILLQGEGSAGVFARQSDGWNFYYGVMFKQENQFFMGIYRCDNGVLNLLSIKDLTPWMISYAPPVTLTFTLNGSNLNLNASSDFFDLNISAFDSKFSTGTVGFLGQSSTVFGFMAAKP